jgi:predicted ATPase
LIDALSISGNTVVPEAGRMIVQEQLANGGKILPWLDMHSFVCRLSQDSIKQFDHVNDLDRPVFFDRGFIEPLAHWRSRDCQAFLALKDEVGARRYSDPVFVAPPWPELFVHDAERRHDFSAATEEYHSICETLTDFNYRQVEIPRMPVCDRTDFIMKQLDIVQKSVQ